MHHATHPTYSGPPLHGVSPPWTRRCGGEPSNRPGHRRGAGTVIAVLPRAALLAVLALGLPVAAAACGGGDEPGAPPPAPQVGVRGEEDEAARDLGFPAFATRNTTRVGGADPVADAAAVARAVFPGPTPDARPAAVALADGGDWRAALPATALMGEPLRAPVLLTEGDELPEATADALDALAPTGAARAAGAQVVRVGATADVEGLRDTDLAPGDPAALAAGVDRFLEQVRGRTAERVVVVSTADAGFAVPAAGWAARSGDPILFVDREAVPAATRRALERKDRPRIYVLGPERVVSARVERELRRLGPVRRIEGPDPVRNAIAFARYTDGDFGWGVVDPGHGLTFVDARRPVDAIAAAPLSATGTFAPVLLHDGGDRLPGALESYLLDIQPGYRVNPVRGVYNHGWIIGDERAMPVAVQSRVDSLLQIEREDTDPPADS